MESAPQLLADFEEREGFEDGQPPPPLVPPPPLQNELLARLLRRFGRTESDCFFSYQRRWGLPSEGGGEAPSDGPAYFCVASFAGLQAYSGACASAKASGVEAADRLIFKLLAPRTEQDTERLKELADRGGKSSRTQCVANGNGGLLRRGTGARRVEW